MIPTSAEISVHKLDSQGEEILAYKGQVLDRTQACVTLEARFSLDLVNLPGLTLKRGDRFVETFCTDRWYNIFVIYDQADEQLKGWYCNITRPARIENDHVYADDLALDMIVYRSGRWLVLDEEEYAALDLTLEERQHALEALTALQTMVVQATGPFSILAG